MSVLDRIKDARDVWVKCEGTMISLNQDDVHELYEEIEKLNNVINELEKFLNKLKINIENDIKYARSKNDDEEIIRLNREFNMTDMVLVKLQKLKGEGKE